MAFTDFDILADSMITDNPSLTAPNTSSNVTVLPEWVSDQIFASTYFEVGLSALTLIVAAANAFWLHYRFPKTLVFRIQKVDSITTSVSQLGFITTLFSSITENPDPFICTVAAALYTFNMYHFIWTSLSISLARQVKVNTASKGDTIPPDGYFLKRSIGMSGCIFAFIFSMHFINTELGSNISPPYDFCVRTHPTDIQPSIFGLAFMYAPLLFMVIFNLYIDHSPAPKFQKPTIKHSHIILNPILDHAPLRTSYISVLLISVGMFHESFLYDVHMSHHVKFLSENWVVSLFLIFNGPLSALWAFRVEQDNLKRAQENLEMMDIQLSAHLQQQAKEYTMDSSKKITKV